MLWIGGMFGGKRRLKKQIAALEMENRSLKARYDLAKYSEQEEKHWINADGLSANAAANPADRKRIREACRYEGTESAWLVGMLRTLTDHVIGTGPRLQIAVDPETDDLDEIDEDNAEAMLREQIANTLEKLWKRWAKRIGLVNKLRVAHTSWRRDGEVFLLLIYDESVKGPIKMNVRLIEADQCTAPYTDPTNAMFGDGIRYDENENPTDYYFLDHHPGSMTAMNPLAGEWYEADRVIHLFRPERPGELRGMPEIRSAARLMASLRRFRRATLIAAEVAASFGGILTTTQTPAKEFLHAFESMEIEHGMLMTAPVGYDLKQLQSQHPSSTFEMFTKVLLNEAARPFSMPLNIAMCNSSGFNFSSGRLDHQTYYLRIGIDQSFVGDTAMDRIFEAFYGYAKEIPSLSEMLERLKGLGRAFCDDDDFPEHEWFWDSPAAIDPMSEDNATETRLASGMSCLQDEYAARGQDWKQQIKKIARSLGMTLADYRRRLANKFLGPDVPASSEGAPVTAAARESEPLARYGGISRLQWKRNRKAIQDILTELLDGTTTEASAMVQFQLIDIPETLARQLIDDALANGRIVEPDELNEGGK